MTALGYSYDPSQQLVQLSTDSLNTMRLFPEDHFLLQTAVCASLLTAVFSMSSPDYSTALEYSLRNELFIDRNYSVYQRPSKNVDVKVSLTLLTVNELNVKDQVLSVSGYLSFSWEDSRLSWTNTSATRQDYSNIDFLFSTEQHVWAPALIIENSIQDMSVISDTKIPMRIKSDGMVFWSPSGVYKVSCESDITYYPLDTQTCFIKVSTWGYSKSEIGLSLAVGAPVDDSFYSENGEWDLISVAGHAPSVKARRGTWYSSLAFSITLRRKPVFHAINTLFPVILMGFLIPMVYKVPTDSGEKLGYSLTVLLAYAVYLTLISDDIPSTSKSVCLLSIYLGLTLAFSTVSVKIVIFILYAHFEGEKAVPIWIDNILKKLRNISRRKGTNNLNQVEPTAKGENCHDKKPTDILENEENNEMDKPVTYREFSAILNTFFFVLFMTVMTVLTLIFLLLLLINYSNNG